MKSLSVLLIRSGRSANFGTVADACRLDARALVAGSGLPGAACRPDLLLPPGQVSALLGWPPRAARTSLPACRSDVAPAVEPGAAGAAAA